jgi:hypothetical protein
MKEYGIERNEVYFIWRNLVATYSLTTKEFNFDHHNMYIVPWDEYPKDMEAFINWVMVCQQHKDEVVWIKYNTNEKTYPEPKTFEVY